MIFESCVRDKNYSGTSCKYWKTMKLISNQNEAENAFLINKFLIISKKGKKFFLCSVEKHFLLLRSCVKGNPDAKCFVATWIPSNRKLFFKKFFHTRSEWFMDLCREDRRLLFCINLGSQAASCCWKTFNDCYYAINL